MTSIILGISYIFSPWFLRILSLLKEMIDAIIWEDAAFTMEIFQCSSINLDQWSLTFIGP